VLAIAAAGMAVAAFAGGDDPAPAPRGSATAAAAPEGLAVWAAQGCGSCHTLAAADSHGTIGPDLGSSLRGMPASYVKESIVAPQAAVAAGYSAGAMPEDYARRIGPADLDRLVTFLLQSAPD
jgi:mono/diheme cytochrome c family protein